MNDRPVNLKIYSSQYCGGNWLSIYSLERKKKCMCRHCYSQHNNYTYYTYITLNLKKLFTFKWRVIALQCAGFIQKHQAATSVHMSPSSLTSQPPPAPSHLSRLSQSPGLSPFCYTANSHFLSSLGMAMYMFPCSSVSSSHLLLSPP